MIERFPQRPPRFAAPALGLGVAAALAVGTGICLWPHDAGVLKARLRSDLPATQISSVDCKTAMPGLCEVTAGQNLFYATHDGRFLVVGSILDLRKKVDLTDERLKQLAAVGAATGGLATSAASHPTDGPAGPPARLDVALPAANAIVHNAGAPIKLKVFSDFNCGYCRMLFGGLDHLKTVEITEYPIAILGADSADKARMVLCSSDRVAASLAAYGSGRLTTRGDCASASAAVAANTQFARAHGIAATPTFIRADGTLNQGYLAPEALKAFAGGTS